MFHVCSASNEICSVYAQPAIKFSKFWMMILNCLVFSPYAVHARKLITHFLSIRENWLLLAERSCVKSKLYSIWPRYSTFKHFLVSSNSDEIVSTYALPAMKYVPCMISQRWNSAYFEWWFWTALWFLLMLCMRENWLLLAEQSCVKSKFWQKLKEKNRHFFRILTKVIYVRFWFRQNKIPTYLMLVYF